MGRLMCATGRALRGLRFGGATTLALLVVVSSCAISEDAAPRDIPDEREVGLGAGATGDAAIGASRIYLLTPATDEEQRRLRSVARDVTPTPEDLLASLLSGPNNSEVENSLGTALPPELELNSALTVGTRLTIDLSNGLAGLSDEGLRLALAQIVATASEIDGVERVRIRVDGADQAWPTGDGRLVEDPLSIYDYPGYLESSQPAFPALPSA